VSTHVYGGVVTGWAQGTITRCRNCGYAVELVEHGYAVCGCGAEHCSLDHPWEAWSHMRHHAVCQQPEPVAATSIDRFLANYG
jgi:hypothetical protein